MSTPITITGRTTSDPELRFTPSGKAVTNLTVAVNHRKKNLAGEWEDDGADFYRVDAWDTLAENVAESILKGCEVVVVGTLRSREWEDKDGGKRTSWEIRADTIAPSLRWATAVVTKAGNDRASITSTTPSKPASSTRKQAPKTDPWAGAQTDAPPFWSSIQTIERRSS